MLHEPMVNSLVSKRMVDIFPCSWLPSPTRSCGVRCFCTCDDGQSDSITTIRWWCSSFHHTPPDQSMQLRLVTATLSLLHDTSAVGTIHRAPPGSSQRGELTKVKDRESLQKRILEQPRAEVLIRVALPQSREPEFQTMTGNIEAQNGKGGYSCDDSCHGLAHGSASGISLMPRDESFSFQRVFILISLSLATRIDKNGVQ